MHINETLDGNVVDIWLGLGNVTIRNHIEFDCTYKARGKNKCRIDHIKPNYVSRRESDPSMISYSYEPLSRISVLENDEETIVQIFGESI